MNDSALTGYRVLARKYRPERFSELIGQEALVRTLENALSLGRLAHAFVLTGVRGVGKTSTARLLARGLNCIGPDGNGGATLEPCGACEPCQAIAASRHVDVLEIDAASHTGVDDAREIIEGVGYRPVSGRFKIYIIDEVHMMSKSAFNALLKTLEEPPDNVKFIFATTEIRKVPVTILSRCQRFDLRRVPTDMLATHLTTICARETITADAEAITAIARAAEGSVRDALSLLDQAAAMTADRMTIDSIAEMLGRPGRTESITILDAAMQGDTASGLAALTTTMAGGAEPEMIIADLMDLVHRASQKAAGGPLDTLLESERDAIDRLAQTGIARLGRAWQMLLKGHGEVTCAPQSAAAAEMLIIRLAHLANMPTPGDIVRRLATSEPPTEATATQATATPATPTPPAASDMPASDMPASGMPASDMPASGMPASDMPASDMPASDMPASDMSESVPEEPSPPTTMRAGGSESPAPQPAPQTAPQTTPAPASAPVAEPDMAAAPQPQSLLEISELAESHDDPLLAAHIRSHVRLVRMQPGLLDICLTDGAPDSLPGDMARRLSDWTGARWMVSLSDGPGGMTITEERRAAQQREIDAVATAPLVQAITGMFPGAEIESVTPLGELHPDQTPTDQPNEERPT